MTELLKEIEEKIKFLLILKAKPLPPGTVRVWGEERYRKGTDRKWRKIGRCVQSNLKNIANKKLTRENIEGLKVVSSRQFNEIVDLLFEGGIKICRILYGCRILIRTWPRSWDYREGWFTFLRMH